MRPCKLPARFCAIPTAALLLALPTSALGQQAYFSLTGNLDAADADQDFGVQFNRDIVAADNPQFKTFHRAGGTNAAGQVIPGGSFDPLLNLRDTFSGIVNVTNDDGGPGFDAFLAYPGNGNTGANLGTLTLPNQIHTLELQKISPSNFGPWAVDISGPASAVELWTPRAAPNSTITDLLFGTDGAEGTTPAVLELNASLNGTLAGNLTVAHTGQATLNKTQSSSTFTVQGLTTINAGGDAFFRNGTFNADGGLVLSTSQLTPFSGANVNVLGGDLNVTGPADIKSGATFTLNNADSTVTFNNGLIVNAGTFTNTLGTVDLAAGQTISVRNNGTYNHTPGTTLNNGSTFAVETGGSATFNGFFGFATSGDGTIQASGDGSTFNIDSAFNTFWANAGNTGTVEVTDDAEANIDFAGSIRFGRSSLATTTGIITVHTGGDLTFTTPELSLGDENSASTVSITVDGAGSTFIRAGGGKTILGGTGTGTATLNVTNGGTLTPGTGDLNINASGTLNVDATSTLDPDGNINVDGGTLDVGNNSISAQWAADKTLTASNGALVNTADTWFLRGGQTIDITTDANFDHVGTFAVGTNAGGGSLNVDGAGSSLDVIGILEIGAFAGSTGTVNVTNAATVDVSGGNGLFLSRSTTDSATSGTLNVNSGGDVTANFLGIGNVDGGEGTGTVSIAGNGSTFTVAGSGGMIVGNADTPGNEGVHRVDVTDDGAFTTGTGTTAVRKTGSINVSGNATWNQNGDLNIEAGVFQLTSGSFSLADGKDINVTGGGRFDYQNGGIPGSLTLDSAGSVVTVSGNGSRFNSLSQGDGFLTIENGVVVNVSGGAILDTDNLFLNQSVVTIDGPGSRLSATSGSDTEGFNFHQVGFGADANLTVRNQATADLRLGTASSVIVGQFGSVETQSFINVESAALLDLDGLLIDTGAVTVAGMNSVINQSAGTVLNVGFNGPTPTATLIVADGGTFNATSGTKTVRKTGVLNVQAGGVFNLGSSTLNNEGILRGNGQITGDVSNAGRVVLDTDFSASFASMVIEGEYTQTSDGLLEFGRVPGGESLILPLYLDILTVTQGLDLAGEIRFIDAADAAPAHGLAGIPLYQQDVLIDVTSFFLLTTTFDTVTGHILGDGTAIAVLYDSQDVNYQRALFGDANLNQQIEQADLDAVLTNWGQTGQTWVTGDFNGNGTVEQADLDAVLTNWGSSAPPNFRGLSIPEPGAMVLGTLAGLSLLRRRRSA